MARVTVLELVSWARLFFPVEEGVLWPHPPQEKESGPRDYLGTGCDCMNWLELTGNPMNSSIDNILDSRSPP